MKVQKIGTYFIENQSCDDEMINEALTKQLALKNEGIYKPLGQILVEIGRLNSETLDLILKRQGKDMLRSIGLFKSLSPEIISRIVDISECQTFSKGEIIIHEGDQGDAFYQIISGLTRVFQLSEDGIEVTLTTLGPGEGFGEMALLTGEPRSASVSALEACSFLVISKDAFDGLATENPEFSIILSKVLSGRLARGSENLVSATATEKAYQRFVSEQSAEEEPHLIGRSKVVKKLLLTIKEAAQDDRPVLIHGEIGTEKRDVAGLIHRNSNRRDGPFLLIDVKTVNLGRVVGKPGERDPIRLELAQNSTLFGHAKGALSFAQERRLGLFQVGDGGTVVIENIENLAAGVQTKLIDFIQHGQFLPLGSQNLLNSSVRVLATSSVDLEQLVEEGRFNEELLYLLSGVQPLIVPPLRKRKKDLRQLVEYLIEHYSERAGKSVAGIDMDVYKSIMAYDWPGNTDELKVVIRRAVNLVQTNQLTPEDILIGMAPQADGKLSFNILTLDSVRQLFQSKAFPHTAQLIFAFFFMLVIFFGFLGSQLPGYNLSLELTWGLWEPLVVISCLFLARTWCAVCPVGASSSLISRKYGFKRNIPSFIRNHGVYLGAVGLSLIFLSEVIFNMLSSPRATAWLIVSITIPAVVLALIYQRRVWCRFLCPLGKLVGFLSRCSFMELRANQNICNSDCTEYSCYVGCDGQEGCPVFEAPFSLQTNQNCILCGNCIKNCKNQSPTLNLRTPGHELWNFLKPDMAISLIGVFIIGSQIFRGLEKTGYLHPYVTAFNQQWIIYSMLIIITTLLAFLFVRTAGVLIFDSTRTEQREKLGLMMCVLVPIVVAFEFGFHFERLISRGGQVLPTLGRQLGLTWDFLEMGIDPWLVKTFQVFFVFIGIVASKAVLKRLIRFRWNDSLKHLSFHQYWPVLLLGVGYILLFFASQPVR